MSEAPDWQLLETFVRVAEAGSLTAGARAMGISQPTASRHIQRLEEQLGVTLFVRHARGLHLSDRGTHLLADARELDARVHALLRQATGLRQQPRGTVRVTAAEPVGAYALGRCFARLRRTFPDIALELVLDNQVANLSRREADLAVRMVQPAQLDLIAIRVGQIPLGLYASEEYLAENGTPTRLSDLDAHTFIGMDRDPGWARQVAELGMSPSQFAFRTDALLGQVQAMLDGVGIGGTHVQIAARYSELQRVLPDFPLTPLPMWLVMHRDVRDNPAVRVVFEAIRQALCAYSAEGQVLADAPSFHPAGCPLPPGPGRNE